MPSITYVGPAPTAINRSDFSSLIDTSCYDTASSEDIYPTMTCDNSSSNYSDYKPNNKVGEVRDLKSLIAYYYNRK